MGPRRATASPTRRVSWHPLGRGTPADSNGPEPVSGDDGHPLAERIGLRDSITGRIEAIGGRVEISSKLGRGTEVRLWAP